MKTIATLIAILIEAPAARRARKLSAEHAERRMQRLEREAVEHVNRQIAKYLRDRSPYPFHA